MLIVICYLLFVIITLQAHLRGHPALERLVLRQLRRENQRIETALVDDGHLLSSSKGVAYHDPLVFVVNMLSQRITCVAVPQGRRHIFTNKEHFSFLVSHCPDFSEHLMFENLYAQRNRPYCVLACYAVFYKLFCMKKDDFLPIFWRCKTIFVTLHHQTRAVMPGAAGTGAGWSPERCRISTWKAADEETKHKTLKYTDGQKCNY